MPVLPPAQQSLLRLFFSGRVSCVTCRNALARTNTAVHLQQRRNVLSEAVSRRLQAMTERHAQVVEKMNEGSGDISALGKEMSALAPVASLAERLSSLEHDVVSVQDLLAEAEKAQDTDMVAECQQELENIKESRKETEQRVLYAILPRDEDDYESNAILEMRAGTGGDEAALFTNELLEAYNVAAKLKGWKFERLSETKTDLGGIKEAFVSISASGHGSYSDADSDDLLSGLGPYGLFRFESGVHRVQRVPVNDSRIHTSACSVAVLPSPADDDRTNAGALLPMSELRIDTFRASGAGGQHVNTTESAVRITHIPTGIQAAIQDERSQHKNKAKALKLVTARVRDRQREDEAKERGDARNSLMGSGDRSERIRTYNYPQDRVTDHRCKHTENGISKLFGGGGEGGLVQTFAPPMRIMHREELIKQLEDE